MQVLGLASVNKSTVMSPTVVSITTDILVKSVLDEADSSMMAHGVITNNIQSSARTDTLAGSTIRKYSQNTLAVQDMRHEQETLAGAPRRHSLTRDFLFFLRIRAVSPVRHLQEALTGNTENSS